MRDLHDVRQVQLAKVVKTDIPELGVASGFTMKLQDRGGHGYDGLIAAQGQLLAMAAESPVLAGVRPAVRTIVVSM